MLGEKQVNILVNWGEMNSTMATQSLFWDLPKVCVIHIFIIVVKATLTNPIHFPARKEPSE